MIAIIDYDAGNLKSVEKALKFLGEEAVITRDKSEILQADKVILPGVGAYGDAMEKIRRYNLIDTIKEVTSKGTPFLGICLGLQLLFDRSEESEGDIKGLSILPGDIVRIPDAPGLKIPHIGWNSLSYTKKSVLFEGIKEDSYVYFVHSYYLKAKNIEDVCATTEYSTTLHVAVEHENIFGCQFHPEKSGEVGLTILKNFAKIGKE